MMRCDDLCILYLQQHKHHRVHVTFDGSHMACCYKLQHYTMRHNLSLIISYISKIHSLVPYHSYSLSINYNATSKG